MKKIAFLIFSATWLQVHAQVDRLDENDQNFLSKLGEKSRVDTLLEWAYDVQKRRHEEVYARAALEWADQAQYSKGRADCYVKLGHLALDAGRYEEAAAWYSKGLHIRDSLGLVSEVASCYNNLGLVQKRLGNFDSADSLFRRGLEKIKSLPADKSAIPVHNNLGAVQRSMGKYEEALKHFRQSMAVSQMLNNVLGAAQARLNIGNLLQDHLGRFDEARDSLNTCLQDFSAARDSEYMGKCLLALANNAYFTGHLTEAIRFADQALTLDAALTKEDRAIAWKNKGRYLLDQRKFDKALELFQMALADFISIGNKREIASTRFEIGNLYYEQAKLADAVENYQKAMDTTLQDFGLRCRVLYFLSDALDQLGRKEEATRYTDEFTHLLSMLKSVPTTRLLEELTSFTVYKSRIKTEMVLRAEQKTRLNALIGLTILAFLLILAMLFAHVQRQKRQLAERNAEIARQSEQLAVQEKLELLKNKELATQAVRLKAQEELQRKIGKKLHDEVGALLTTVKLYFPTEEEHQSGKSVRIKHNNFKKANQILDQACEKVRSISHELSDALLIKFGLKARLESFADDVRNSGKMAVELGTHNLEERLDSDLELQTFHIVQELATNVIRHARASAISIQVNRFVDKLNIIVEDNGQGFNVENAMQKPGFGLGNLQARIHDLEGEMMIDSRTGHGTTIVMDIPLTSALP